jgi:hypothetical protein
MPYALVYVYSLTFGDFEFFNQIWQIRTSLNFEVLTHNTMAVYLAIIIGIGLMSFILNTLRTVQFSNEFRGLWSLVFVHFILATCLLFSGRDFETLNTAYIIFPLSIILANHLQNMTIKWRKEVFIYIFIGLTFSKIAYNLLP